MPRRKKIQDEYGYEPDEDYETSEAPEIAPDPSEHRKGPKTIKNNRLPFKWIKRQFLEGDYTETLKWHPWRKDHTSSTGVKSYKTEHHPKILIMISKSAYHPVKDELQEYNPDLVIGLWSKELKSFISFIIPVITYKYPTGKDRWSKTPTEYFGFQTYKKILHPKDSGLLQHYYPLIDSPDAADYLQIIQQEIADLGSNTHF